MDANAARTVADFLISELENEIPTTMKVLRSVPSERLDYRPDKMSKTALGLVRHITLEDEWMLNSIADGAFTPPPDDSDACGIMTPAEATARYQQRIPTALQRVRAMTAEQLTRQIDMLGAIQMPAICFLSLMVKHSVHHRGQLSSYLRAMGGKVPGIYGPSADTLAAMQTAAAGD